jgi:hypothetical protein
MCGDQNVLRDCARRNTCSIAGGDEAPNDIPQAREWRREDPIWICVRPFDAQLREMECILIFGAPGDQRNYVRPHIVDYGQACCFQMRAGLGICADERWMQHLTN